MVYKIINEKESVALEITVYMSRCHAVNVPVAKFLCTYARTKREKFKRSFKYTCEAVQLV